MSDIFDNSKMLVVVHDACVLNKKLADLVAQSEGLDPIVKETVIAALHGNTLLITKMSEHNLEILDMIENFVHQYQK